MNMPYAKSPCKDCPFRTDTQKGWLGAAKIRRNLLANSFTCHNAKKKRLQCAGHMLIKSDYNLFVKVAKVLGMKLDLKGKDKVFKSDAACIEHHS